MRILLILLIFTLSSPFTLIHAAGNVGDPCCDNNQCTTQVTCNAGLSCCYTRPVWMESIGGKCYDPKASTCAWCPVYNPNHPQTQVCPNSAPTCCNGCIDSTQQCCHHFGSWDYWNCGADQTCCGFNNGQNTCCNKDQQCINDMCVPRCPPGTLTCGTSCYQAKDYVCADASHSTLCPVSSPNLCGDACYSDAQYTCVVGHLQPRAPNPTNAPTTAAPTPAPGCVLPGDLKCGNRCYSPVTHVCANAGNNQLCPVAYPLACGDACYSSTQYSCSNGHLVLGPTPAAGCVRPGDLKCGNRCYSPITHVCANAGNSQLCPVAYPSACGDACYSSAQYTCSNGQLSPICVIPGDLKCGIRCYSPTTHVCANAADSFLCPVNQPSACGKACYSATQYKCVNGKLQPL